MATLKEALKDDPDKDAVLAKFSQLEGVSFDAVVSVSKALRKLKPAKFKKLALRCPLLCVNVVRKDRQWFSKISDFLLELTGKVFFLDGSREGISDNLNLALVRLFADCMTTTMANFSDNISGMPSDWFGFLELASKKALVTNSNQDTTKGLIIEQNRRKLASGNATAAMKSVRSLLIKQGIVLGTDDTGYTTETAIVSQ